MGVISPGKHRIETLIGEVVTELHADGKLKPGETWHQASILNTVFEGRVEELENGRVTPIISGTAFVTSEANIIIQDSDPFKHGITLT